MSPVHSTTVGRPCLTRLQFPRRLPLPPPPFLPPSEARHSMTLPFRSLVAACFTLIVSVTGPVRAAETQAGRTPLPQSHPYQVVLRNYLATLQESDFDHGVIAPLTVAERELD